jgi:heme-degrading monooxygenase HmoA
MFMTVYLYRARANREDDVFALYENWRRRLHEVPGYVSCELLANTHDLCEFIQIARFEDEASAWAAAEDSEHYAWYARLVALAEVGPTVTYYESV